MCCLFLCLPWVAHSEVIWSNCHWSWHGLSKNLNKRLQMCKSATCIKAIRAPVGRGRGREYSLTDFCVENMCLLQAACTFLLVFTSKRTLAAVYAVLVPTVVYRTVLSEKSGELQYAKYEDKKYMSKLFVTYDPIHKWPSDHVRKKIIKLCIRVSGCPYRPRGVLSNFEGEGGRPGKSPQKMYIWQN